MKHLHSFMLSVIFLAFFPSLILAQESDKLSAKDIASHYDDRARKDESGYNKYQKKETFIDKYNMKRYRITTLYENMNINQAYESYVANSTGQHFENHNAIADRCKFTMWPTKLPKENKTLNWHYDNDLACDGIQKNERWLDITLNYRYINPKNVTVTYTAFGTEFYHPTETDFILEFKQEEKGTYLTISSKALPVSFDCKKAGNETEKAICKASENDNFNEDAKLHYLYKGLIAESFESDTLSEKKIKSEQIAWIKKRNQCKNNINCIKQSYISRYNEIYNQLKNIYSERYGLNNCSYLHDTAWDGALSYPEYSKYARCQFKGDVIQAYEAVIKKYNDINQYFSSLEQIKQKKNIHNEVNDPNGGIYYINYDWKNNTLKFTIAYEYSGIIYTFLPNKGLTEIIIEDYYIP